MESTAGSGSGSGRRARRRGRPSADPAARALFTPRPSARPAAERGPGARPRVVAEAEAPARATSWSAGGRGGPLPGPRGLLCGTRAHACSPSSCGRARAAGTAVRVCGDSRELPWPFFLRTRQFPVIEWHRAFGLLLGYEPSWHCTGADLRQSGVVIVKERVWEKQAATSCLEEQRQFCRMLIFSQLRIRAGTVPTSDATAGSLFVCCTF